MSSPRARRGRLIAAIVLAVSGMTGAAVHSATASAATPTSTSITLDGNASGRVFDGVGAASGGGGNSRLLIDYPEPQRSQILDYLFKPGYGADLQILKLEIGGDTNSTDGAEPSIEHAKGSVVCDTGYEFWLAQQAKARNPNIKLYGLSWGAPGWIGTSDPNNPTPGQPYFWSTDMIDYLMSWMGCAKADNLSIDYLGGWNERGYNKAWYENLKSTLSAKGYGATKVVADDSFSWDDVSDLSTDSTFNSAVDVVGDHYPCGYLGAMSSCTTSSTAQGLGKPLWASESGSQDTNTGAGAVARALNRDYIDGKITAYINWPVVAALYPNLDFSTDGLAVAKQPWSGNYSLGKTMWVTAQTTQFTAPGWQYLDSGSGYLGGAASNGSYVSLKSTNGTDYSTIVETMDATASQTATFTVSGGLSTGKVHVWSTNVNSSSSADWFVQGTDITPSASGTYTVTLQPGYVYSFTTTTGQGKGTATPPAAAPLTLPYSDTFETAAATSSPKYFSDMNGAFSTDSCDGGRTGTCLRQESPVEPIHWTKETDHDPYTIIGNTSWADYTVSADVFFEKPGSLELLGRVNQQGKNNQGLDAYRLRLSASGAWSLIKSDLTQTETTLASGTTTAPGSGSTGTWHTLALKMQGKTLTALLDGATLGSATDTSFTNGMAGLGVRGFQTDEFDNFALTTNPSTPQTGPITSGVTTAKCVDDNGNSSVSGTKVQLWDCTGGAAQKWTWSNGALTVNGKCMTVANQGTTNGSLVQIWDCGGGADQQWSVGANGSLVSAKSGKCLDDPGFTVTNGTQLDIWTCNGGANQKWNLP